MNTANVRAFAPTVNASPEDVIKFLRQKADRGEIAGNSARLKITAVTQLAGILQDDEPKTAEYLRENVASVADRWATLNNGGATGDTAKTYESRARAAIDDYFAWVKDPKGFKFKRREPPVQRGEKKPSAEPATAQPEPVASAPTPSADAVGELFRSFPLGSDREPFRFVLPPQLKVHDVRKIVCHLLTLADDFDPGVPSHAQVFSIVMAQE